MDVDPLELRTEAALESERQFVLTLGGFALDVAGASLVTHEKIPAPRFNFVQELGVGRERQTAFFERALDHYFQRALRPTFRVPVPPSAHVDLGLRRLGFVPRASPLVLLLEDGASAPVTDDGVEVREAARSELEQVAAFWSDERERPELRTAIDVAWHHPNPHERLVPLVASIDGAPVAAAIVYRYRLAAGVHFVATRPSARGRGAASALVTYALRERPAGRPAFLSMFADSPRLQGRLARLGFSPARSFVEYELPRNAELALPRPGPPTPPRWRPPRSPTAPPSG
ncbi:MAG TPA: GNAT family N-acetyltransferase [Thermoplasmata archaeon]|nr:GNAT family N-acetyltransferase [Thermoplasmata archaeon]